MDGLIGRASKTEQSTTYMVDCLGMGEKIHMTRNFAIILRVSQKRSWKSCKVQTSQASSRSRIPNRRSRGIWEGRTSTCTVGVYGLDEADFLDNS
jgi:hypothetical protein